MLRMGMLGNSPMTFEEIGEQLEGLTRERVRQMTDKMEEACRYRIHQKKLQPLIKRTSEIVTSRGGKIGKEALVSLLLAHGPDGKMLRFATPFIDFLSTLDDWKEAGLKIGEDGVVFTEDFSLNAIITSVASDIVRIAHQNADEIINEDLWSIDYNVLKKLATDCFNRKYPNEEDIQELSDTIIDEALSVCHEKVKKRGNRVYSRDLWVLRYDNLCNSIEAILKTSKKAMHFTEVHGELKKYRSSLSERNAYARLEKNENLLLWGRGTFIHKTHVSIPHVLISDIEGWILEQLRREVPFISVYGPFKFFEQRCLEANIPNEYALYSVLRELSHPLIAYPWCPYIYLNKGNVKKIPIALAIDQFLQDFGGPVSYDELKSYVLERLYLKDFQFEQIKYELPNTIRTDDGSFLHIDCLEIDVKKFNEIVAYVRKIVSKEKHVSVARIFDDKKISCKILGIDGPIGLFSLFQIMIGDEFDLRNYPQIRFLSRGEEKRERGIMNEVVSYIKEKSAPYSYQELREVFVDKQGYNERTISQVRYKDGVYNYLRDCLIHRDTIGWNETKQEHIEKVACERYNECVKMGKPYGLIKEMIEFAHLPDLGEELYWTPYLLADVLVSREHFKILGSEKNAFVPIPNDFGIETFEDLVYEILKREYDGGANLNEFAEYLRESGIIRRNLTESMLGESQKVRIVGKEIVMSELIDNA
jgi:hypothetical protein